MRLRPAWLVCLCCLGCHLAEVDTPPPADNAAHLWQQGQQAMQAGQPAAAIGLYEKSLAEDQKQSQNHLSLAAAYVEAGDDEKACEHLGKFLRTNPDHRTARVYHAELLRKLNRPAEALAAFEQAIAHGQDAADPAQLVHCHGRLVELAEAVEEDYLQHLHRGIGMYLLAKERATLADPAGDLPAEALLCKAAAELSRARALRPQEARPALYLYASWHQLAQHGLAKRWLAEAQRAAPFSYLTPAEQRRLQLALR
jgi:tetratricopeptide (TPR) repeat protein